MKDENTITIPKGWEKAKFHEAEAIFLPNRDIIEWAPGTTVHTGQSAIHPDQFSALGIITIRKGPPIEFRVTFNPERPDLGMFVLDGKTYQCERHLVGKTFIEKVQL